jgi:hypothetical protein
VIRAAVLALLLAGCAAAPSMPAPPPALHAMCSTVCMADCLPAEWPQWQCIDPDAPECWDEQAATLALPLQQIARQCDAARRACLACLRRLEAVGAICGVGDPCGS